MPDETSSFVWIKNTVFALACGDLEILPLADNYRYVSLFNYMFGVKFSQAITFIAISYYLAAVMRKAVEILPDCACCINVLHHRSFLSK